jgi:DNA gyrase subunit A
VISMKFKKQSKEEDEMSYFWIVKEDDEILVNTSRGIMVRQKVQQIPCQRLYATGVVIEKVDGSDRITSVSVLPVTTEDDEWMGIKPNSK